MICSQCQRSGYNFQKMGSKTWCGACDMPGTRTITQTMAESAGGFTPYGMGGLGTINALPKLCTIAEWREIARLCKTISSDRLLLEETPKTLPLPTNSRNPLNGSDRAGWLPLEEYLKQPQQGRSGNPYGFTSVQDYFGSKKNKVKENKPEPESRSNSFEQLKRLMEG